MFAFIDNGAMKENVYNGCSIPHRTILDTTNGSKIEGSSLLLVIYANGSITGALLYVQISHIKYNSKTF